MTIPPIKPTPLETPCLEWRGSTSPAGYGTRRAGPKGRRRKVYVHRWVMEQIVGPLAPGVEVLHRCDNPPCFRFDHLIQGTRQMNAADMAAKGRSRRGNRPRRETCRRYGHPIKENPDGHRWCPTCQAMRRKERR